LLDSSVGLRRTSFGRAFAAVHSRVLVRLVRVSCPWGVCRGVRGCGCCSGGRYSMQMVAYGQGVSANDGRSASYCLGVAGVPAISVWCASICCVRCVAWGWVGLGRCCDVAYRKETRSRSLPQYGQAVCPCFISVAERSGAALLLCGDPLPYLQIVGTGNTVKWVQWCAGVVRRARSFAAGGSACGMKDVRVGQECWGSR